MGVFDIEPKGINWIKRKLKRRKLTQVWLIEQLNLKGLKTSKTELSMVLAGTRKGNKAKEICELSIDILEEYERKMLWR